MKRIQKLNLSNTTLFFTMIALVFAISIPLAFAAHQAQNGEFVYAATLSGDDEVPSVTSDTSGSLDLRISEDMNEATFDLHVEDGEAITMAHLHCAVEGENGPVFAFLFGEIPGGFDVDGTLSAFTLTNANILDAGADCPTPIENIEDLGTAIGGGEVYVNVHSVENPSGEVRGQLAPVPQDDGGNNDDPDTDGDGFISVAEGVPFYGGIVTSLTTSGSTTADSALALDRFPTADNDGDYNYARTITLSEDITDLEDLHVVIHGADIDNNGAYDGEKESSIAAGVPFEATVPVACGIVELNSDGMYVADINQLNSTGVNGDLEIAINSDGDAEISMQINNTSPNLPHAQHLHLGGSNECPPNTIGVDQEEEDDEDNLTYKVTIENLTDGQPFSPPVAATHDNSVNMFSVGEDASSALEAIAEDGNPMPMFNLFNGASGVTDTVNLGRPLTPDGIEREVDSNTITSTASFEINAKEGDVLSLASMLICTNDGFYGLDSIELPEDGSEEYMVTGYDAGTEDNTETSADIVDPCSGLGPITLDGDPDGNNDDTVDTTPHVAIANHNNIVGDNELTEADHGWSNSVAKITIELIEEEDEDEDEDEDGNGDGDDIRQALRDRIDAIRDRIETRAEKIRERFNR